MSKNTTEENEKSVPAFTEEQIKILKTAFNITWERIKRFQEYIDGEQMRQTVLLSLLEKKGVVTSRECDAMDEVYLEASVKVKGDWECYTYICDSIEYMEGVLRGENGEVKIKMRPLEEDGEPGRGNIRSGEA